MKYEDKKLEDLFEIRIGYSMSRVLEQDESDMGCPLRIISGSNISALYHGENVSELETKKFKRSFYDNNKEILLRKNDIGISL